MNDKQLVEFERFYEDTDRCQLTAGDRYGPLKERVKGYLFECWKAAIASVVVELPKPTWNDEYNIGDVKQAIENSGVRYE